MAAGARVICTSHELLEGGLGVRFEVEHEGDVAAAFAVRHAGKVYAYLNRCAHIGVELDWMPGQFFEDSGLYLICATHGAIYGPNTGRCVQGPCKGRSLIPLDVYERDGKVMLR